LDEQAERIPEPEAACRSGRMTVGERAAGRLHLVADLAVVLLVAAERDVLQLLLRRFRFDDRRPNVVLAAGADFDAVAGAGGFDAERLQKAFLLFEVGHREPELEDGMDAGLGVGKIDLWHAHVLPASVFPANSSV